MTVVKKNVVVPIENAAYQYGKWCFFVYFNETTKNIQKRLQ